MLPCSVEPFDPIGIHVWGAGIHLTFTSLTLASTCVAARRFDSIKLRVAGVIKDDSNGEYT
jgi:hypothetical protein